jgi:hypothetical protein
LVEMDAEDVPPEYLLEAQTRVTPVAPTKTPFVPTSTYVPTKTPFAPTPTRTPTKTPTP